MKTQAYIQKWGNGLALRVSGVIRDIPHFEAGMVVMVDVTEDGFTVRKIKTTPKKKHRFSEKELLNSITPATAHADEIAQLGDDEIGAE